MWAVFTYANIRLIEPFCRGTKKDAGYEFLDISEIIRTVAGNDVNLSKKEHLKPLFLLHENCKIERFIYIEVEN